MLLSDYLGLGEKLDLRGVFDPIMNEDSNFFINLQRLKKTNIPEFSNSYQRIHDYFRRIIKLLDKAQDADKTDVFYKQALKLFDFSEVNGICLGYAKGKNGTGFGPVLSKQVINTAFHIVKAGVNDPEFFELLPLFQDNVGADRLSDMIATLIIEDIKAYTKRVNNELGINKDNYPDCQFREGFLINPFKKDVLLLVPIDVLHKLPVAESWEEIDLVVVQNSTLRAEMNDEVAQEWTKYSTKERKSYLRQTVFESPDSFNRILNGYRMEELDEFNPTKDFQYFLGKVWQSIEKSFNCKSAIAASDSYSVSIDLINLLKRWVENNKGWEVICSVESRKREKLLQRIIHGFALSLIETNNLDISCEPDEGRGPVDFKISRGQDITIIEVKLTSNNQYLHGYKIQIEEYGHAERTDSMVYVLIDMGHPARVKKVQDLHDKLYNDGHNPPTLIIIDASEKKSASRT